MLLRGGVGALGSRYGLQFFGAPLQVDEVGVPRGPRREAPVKHFSSRQYQNESGSVELARFFAAVGGLSPMCRSAGLAPPLEVVA